MISKDVFLSPQGENICMENSFAWVVNVNAFDWRKKTISVAVLK